MIFGLNVFNIHADIQSAAIGIKHVRNYIAFFDPNGDHLDALGAIEDLCKSYSYSHEYHLNQARDIMYNNIKNNPELLSFTIECFLRNLTQNHLIEVRRRVLG